MKKVIIVIAIAITATSCSSTYNCPAYGSINKLNTTSVG